MSEHKDGTWSVWHGNRPVANGFHSAEAAEAVVAHNRQPGEKVLLAEADGYRTDLSRKYAALDLKSQRPRQGSNLP